MASGVCDREGYHRLGQFLHIDRALLIVHIEIHRGGFDIGMSELLLQCIDIDPIDDTVRGVCMPQGVWMYSDPCRLLEMREDRMIGTVFYLVASISVE